MRPIFALVSAMLPYCTGLLTIYIMLLIVGENLFPLGVILGAIFGGFLIYCFFVLPFYGVVYYIRMNYTGMMFAIGAPLVVFIQGLIVSLAMHVPLFSEPMIRFIFPLFFVMMLSFVCCIFVFTKRVK